MVSYRQFEHVVETSFDTTASLFSHENVDFIELGTTIQQFFQENFSHETGTASDEDILVYVEDFIFGLW